MKVKNYDANQQDDSRLSTEKDPPLFIVKNYRHFHHEQSQERMTIFNDLYQFLSKRNGAVDVIVICAAYPTKKNSHIKRKMMDLNP